MTRIIKFTPKFRNCWVCTKKLNNDCVLIKRDEYRIKLNYENGLEQEPYQYLFENELIYMFCSYCFDNKKYLLKSDFINDVDNTCYEQLNKHFPELFKSYGE